MLSSVAKKCFNVVVLFKVFKLKQYSLNKRIFKTTKGKLY